MIVLLLTCLAALLCPAVHCNNSTKWCYESPECNFTTWPQIAPMSCDGSSQSPINIVTTQVQGNSNLTQFNLTGFDDTSTFTSIENNGESVFVHLKEKLMSVQGGGLPGLYISKQFHFHWGNGSSSPGSEHTVDGKQYAMELHIVNIHSKYNGDLTTALASNDSSALAPFGFLIEGTDEPNKTKSWDILTSYLANISNPESNVLIPNQITMNSLLEGVDKTKYYRYQGSLTIPNCSEVVIWTVFKEPIKVSHDLIKRFSTTVFFKDSNASVLITNNFRGVQPLNGRVVTTQVQTSTASSMATSLLSLFLVLLLASCM